MKSLFLKVKAFIANLPFPFYRAGLVVVVAGLVLRFVDIDMGQIITVLVAFAAGGYFWDGTIKKVRNFLGKPDA